MYFSAAASSENDQGSMNLASNTASAPSTIPSRVAAIQGIAEYPRFSRQSWIRAASSLPMMIRASEPPIKVRRPSVQERLLWSICKPYYYLFQAILYIKYNYQEVKQFKIN